MHDALADADDRMVVYAGLSDMQRINGWDSESISAFVMALAHGGENFYDGWMKNKKSAMISCNDGFRPVSFLLETMDEEADG